MTFQLCRFWKPCGFTPFKLDRASVRRWAIENNLAHAVPAKRVLAPCAPLAALQDR